jgi:hypothetical protein
MWFSSEPPGLNERSRELKSREFPGNLWVCVGTWILIENASSMHFRAPDRVARGILMPCEGGALPVRAQQLDGTSFDRVCAFEYPSGIVAGVHLDESTSAIRLAQTGESKRRIQASECCQPNPRSRSLLWIGCAEAQFSVQQNPSEPV